MIEHSKEQSAIEWLIESGHGGSLAAKEAAIKVSKQIAAKDAEIERLKGYAGHKTQCIRDFQTNGRCTCGLQQLLEKGTK